MADSRINNPKLGHDGNQGEDRISPIQDVLGNPIQAPFLRKLNLGGGYWCALPLFHQIEKEEKAVAELRALVDGSGKSKPKE